jgi:hypothetical protein
MPAAPVFVWECLGEPGYFGLCTNPQKPDFQTPNWKLRGQLPVPELGWVSRELVDQDTVNEWHRVVRVDRRGSYQFWPGGVWPPGLP